MENKDKLIDDYGYKAEVFSKCYDMMGRLLDKDFIKKEVVKRQMSNIYIYGGGYLGIQLYRSIMPFVNVISVVDKSGRLRLENEDIPVIDMNIFRDCYIDELVIVTPIQYYREIYHELQGFVSSDKIVFLEEFGGK